MPSFVAAAAYVCATPTPYVCVSFRTYTFLKPSDCDQSASAGPWMSSVATTRA